MPPKKPPKKTKAIPRPATPTNPRPVRLFRELRALGIDENIKFEERVRPSTRAQTEASWDKAAARKVGGKRVKAPTKRKVRKGMAIATATVKKGGTGTSSTTAKTKDSVTAKKTVGRPAKRQKLK